MNDEWMYGRNKRGCEGIFPISYVDIRVPLKSYPETDSGTVSRSESVSPAGNRVRVLYTFNAEAEGDLTINVSMREIIFDLIMRDNKMREQRKKKLLNEIQ